MRRKLATALTLLVLLTTSALAGQDTVTVAPVTTGTPQFRAGQWAATFGVANSFYGIGALRFSTSTTAWALAGTFSASHNTQGPSDYNGNYVSTSLSAGRRWFRPGAGRVRPYTELGVSGGYSWGKTEYSGYRSIWQGYAASVYGQLGAQIFFAPELSLGASWNASLGYHHDHNENTGGGSPSSSNDRDSFSADGGRIQLVGTLYF